MSPSPSARISASVPGQSRSASHSAGCPSCDLWCTNPDLPAEENNKTSQEGATWNCYFDGRAEGGCFVAIVSPRIHVSTCRVHSHLFTRLDRDVFCKDFLGF